MRKNGLKMICSVITMLAGLGAIVFPLLAVFSEMHGRFSLLMLTTVLVYLLIGGAIGGSIIICGKSQFDSCLDFLARRDREKADKTV